MLAENRIRRFLARAVPWRPLFLLVLAIATVPALTVGLIAEAYALATGSIPAPYPDRSTALLLVAAPLAALLLATAVLHLRARARTARTLRREAERTNGRLGAILGASEDAIVLLDPRGCVTAWSPGAERLYAIAAADALGLRFETLIDRRDRAAARDAFLVVVAADRRATTEGRHRRGSSTFPTTATWSAVRSPDGTVDGVAVHVRETTGGAVPARGADADNAHGVAGAPEAREAATILAPAPAPADVPVDAEDARALAAAEAEAAALAAATTLELAAAEAARAAERQEEAERRSRLLTDAAADAVIGADDAGMIVGWNPAATRLFGITEERALGTPLHALLADDGTGRPVHDGAPVRITCRRADGSTFPAELSIASYEDLGRTWHTAFIRDITERLATETLAAEHESRYRDLVERLPGVIYRAKVGRWAPIVYVSPHIRTLLGYDPEEWIGVPGIWEEHIHPADLERVLAEDEAESSAPAGVVQGEDREYRMRTRDGREIWVRDHADLERDDHGAPVAWNGFLADITERKHLESELLRLAFHDPLTGLANRALLNDRVAHAVERNEREPGMMGMLMIDVDDFKRINDAHGHDAGDRFLLAVAERLKSCVRADATIARLGGDEFAILLEGLTDDAAALVVAQRVVRAFDRPLRIEGATVSGRVSVGVAVDITGKRSASWLMRSADTAMYEAKRLGKARWQAYDPAAHLASAKRLVLENELRRAVDRKQFLLAYQPVIDLGSGEIVGSEALIRWNHPTRGIVPPAEFISVLESTGLIEPVGRWVVDEACRQSAVWQQTIPSLAWTSVNVSAAQLRSDAFYACVRDALATHGLCPSRLTLEITESLALDDAVGNIERLTALRELGTQIAVDDFGTGYSSLSVLRRLPIDKLKIDRAFVDGLGSDPEATTVARAIVELAKGLRLSTIAEGIEHRHQADSLRALGCDLGQGYLFAKPLRAEDLAALVAGRRAAAATTTARPVGIDRIPA